MAVFELVKKDNTETVQTLAYLLYEAQRGDIEAVSGTFRRRDGDEERVATGVYQAHPEIALMAILRYSMALMRANGELDNH